MAIGRLVASRCLIGGRARVMTGIEANASSSPPAPPINVSSTLSASIWRTNLPADAPTATRMSVAPSERANPKTQSPCHQSVDDLVTFCSESKAATTKLFLARPTQGNPDNQQAYRATFMECELHDASGQRLQLRAREAFPQSEVQRELFELLRRTSLTRQSLSITQ